jgi:hypothetical protein
MARVFIEETISMLKKASTKIENIWVKFQNGEMTKEEFENEYEHMINDWVIDEAQHEGYNPNNGCKYSDTNPDCEYFKKMGI